MSPINGKVLFHILGLNKVKGWWYDCPLMEAWDALYWVNLIIYLSPVVNLG